MFIIDNSLLLNLSVTYSITKDQGVFLDLVGVHQERVIK
jgi:hypothetical protein